MDFNHLIAEAYKITLKNKVLWIFGVVVAVFGGFPQVFTYNFNFPVGPTGSAEMEKSAQNMPKAMQFLEFVDPSKLLLLVGLALIIFLTLFLVSIYLQTWATAALISQTLGVLKGESIDFKKGSLAGEKYFSRILLFRFILMAPLLPIILVLVGVPLMFFLADLKLFAAIFMILDILILIIGLIAYSVVVGIVSEFGFRRMIERDLGVVESAKQGWELFRENLGTSLTVWIVNLALSFVISLPISILVFIFVVLGIPFFMVNPWLIVVPVLAFLAVGTFVGGLWNVFLFSYWSLAYNRVSRKGES
ncbi:MAG: hypothetical protein WD231_00615 [Candidatus Woykebacteria bacterium]